MTTTTELDPNLLKALEYFRSNSLDSAEKLKMMLDEAIENSKRWQDSKEMFGKTGKLSYKSVKATGTSADRKRENSLSLKRPHEKVQRDSDDVLQEGSKKSLDSFSSLGTNSSLSSATRLPSKHRGSPAPDSLTSSNGTFKKSPLGSNVDDEFELEMANLACATCKDMSVGLGNQLVECQECHNLYHQDCHQPPISDKEVNDPRCIWYCAKCKQNMKKQEKQNLLHSPYPSHALGNSLDPFREKTIEVKDRVHITPFKRTELKPTIPAGSNSGSSLSGWAALSGKPIPSTQKDVTPKSSETKPEPSIHRTLSSGSKEKSKSSKNHVKNSQSKYVVSDAWAEALGAKSSVNEKVKSSSNKASGNSGGAKHIQLSSATWLSSPGTNNSNKHKSLNSMSPKSAPFPKASAATSPIAKSASPHDNAAKQMQMMKKKAAAKMQQKRARV